MVAWILGLESPYSRPQATGVHLRQLLHRPQGSGTCLLANAVSVYKPRRRSEEYEEHGAQRCSEKLVSPLVLVSHSLMCCFSA